MERAWPHLQGYRGQDVGAGYTVDHADLIGMELIVTLRHSTGRHTVYRTWLHALPGWTESADPVQFALSAGGEIVRVCREWLDGIWGQTAAI